MRRDASFWLLLLLQVLLCYDFIRLDRSAEAKVNLRPIYWDVVSYYAYLPALVVEGDLRLTFLDKPDRVQDRDLSHRYWPEITPSGQRVIKTTMGVALMMSPFFGLAHLLAPYLGYTRNGFDRPYQMGAALAGFFWGSLGLWLLRAWWLCLFGPWAVGLGLILTVCATNLWNYLVYEPAMSHSFTFALMSLLLRSTHQTYLAWGLSEARRKHPLEGPTGVSSLWWPLGMAFSLGMLVLIRPTMALSGLIPLCYRSFDGIPGFLNGLWKRPLLSLSLILVALLPWSLQSAYWLYSTGQWIFYSYQGEGFFWLDPRWREFLWSYRKGWLLYNPIAWTVVFAWFWAIASGLRNAFMRHTIKEAFPLATLLLMLLPLVVYVYSSWWCWWFGGSLGGRVMVDWYPLWATAALGMFHAVREDLRSWRPARWTTGVLVFALALGLGFCVALQRHQSWQYKIALLHWDATGQAWYRAVWWRSSFPSGLEGLAVSPDPEAARKGKGREAETWTLWTQGTP